MARRSPPDTLRSAVDRTVQATVGQAGKVRDALDDLRLATGDDVKSLSARLDALEKRVAKLERRKA